ESHVGCFAERFCLEKPSTRPFHNRLVKPRFESPSSTPFVPKAGIVGLPNVGNSTLFNALPRSRKAEAANYPFCTIDPNVGVVTVPDDRLAVLQKIAKT